MHLKHGITLLLWFAFFLPFGPLGYKVSVSAQITHSTPCPVIQVECPDSQTTVKTTVFKANVSGGPLQAPTYKWSISAGKIVKGQGTNTIEVDTRGVKSGSVTARVKVGGFHRDCPTSASCSLQLIKDAKRRPNMIFILVDDLRWDDLGIMGHPFLKTPSIDRIGREGALFRNAFVTTPLCSPSRASFLTGLYPHTHGITDNVDRSVASHKLITFPLLLRESGYATAFIGKWHMGNDDSPRPGFDRWVSFKGQGSYIDPDINEDGRDVNPRGYITDILNRYAVEFIRRPHDKPFLVYLAHKAIHPEVMQHGDGSVNLDHAERFIPAERHKQLFAGEKIPRRPSAMRPPTGKPALQRPIAGLPPLGPGTATRDEVVLGRLRSVMAIEEGVREIFRALKETGQLDNTVIVLASDNGYFYGEHGLSVERRLAYEESIRMPLLMRYPKVIKAGTVRDEFALNIDVAPTLLELAGVSAPKVIEGRSLVSLLKGEETRWRKSFVLEYYSDRVFPRIRQMGYKAIRNERWKYIHYFELEGMDELYDLQADPFEMNNLINQPNAVETIDKLKREMKRLLL